MISVPKSARDGARQAGRPGADQAAGRGNRPHVRRGQQPRVSELAVGDDHWLVRGLQHGHGGIEAGVGAVDHDAQSAALGDHSPAEPAQPAVHRRFGLHVADL